MTQHCKANPCCGDVPCSGVPIPQDASGLTAHNPVEVVAETFAPEPKITSTEAFIKTISIIDAATSSFGVHVEVGAMAYCNHLKEAVAFIGIMDAWQQVQIGLYMDAAGEKLSQSLAASVEKAFSDEG